MIPNPHSSLFSLCMDFAANPMFTVVSEMFFNREEEEIEKLMVIANTNFNVRIQSKLQMGVL